jgi:hypothetical protein
MEPFEREPALPEPLQSALRRLGAQEAHAGLDRSVLDTAAPILARARARSRRRRIAMVVLPLAAAAALVFLLVLDARRILRVAVPDLGLARADLDRNGRVDILDAFQLAREIERGGAPRGRDQNGDGRVDRADVDQLAHLAVRLGA